MIQKLTPDNRKPYDRPNDNVTKVLVQSAGDGKGIYVIQSSMRFNRKKFTVAVTGFVVGAVVILFQSPFRNQLITPGPLNSTHAQIIAAQSGDQCAACHDAGSQDPGEWLMAMFRPGKKVQACQSKLCMECHSQSLNKQYASKPHNMSPEKLQQITAKHDDKYVSFKAGFDPPLDNAGNIECSSCHREHHGQDDLMAITDQQCQSCHAVKFDSFESNHPEFVHWPQQRRQRIAFDHTSHGFKHFPGKNAKFDCSMCHVDDRFQSVKLLASYEETCAQCHQQDIDGRSESGVPLLAMPMMDLDAISGEKQSIGFWPANASGDFDGRIPELMRLLLFKDEQARKVLQKHGPDFEFGDLDPDDAGDVDDAVQLAWSIKYLIYDLATVGTAELRSRLEFAFQRSISENEFNVLASGLDEKVFARAANRWLPGLAQEVPDHRARSVNGASVASLLTSDPFRYFKDDDPGLLRKNPLVDLLSSQSVADSNGNFEQVVDTANAPADETTQQQAELQRTQTPATPQGTRNWLTHEVEPAAAAPENSNLLQNRSNISDAKMAKKNHMVPQIPEDELLAKNPLARALIRIESNPLPSAPPEKHSSVQSIAKSPAPDRDANPLPGNTNPVPSLTLSQDTTSSIDDAELLANNPLSLNARADSSLHKENNAPAPVDEAGDNETRRNKPLLSELPKHEQQQLTQEFVEQLNDSKRNQPPRNNDSKDQFRIEAPGDELFVSSSLKSGWFRNDGLFQISYRPSGHADKFLLTMMNIVGNTQNLHNNPAAMPYFTKMVSESSVGACNDCHTIDSVDDKLHVNWRAQYRDPMLRSFTRFSHGPHLTQVQLKDCTSCHSVESTHSNAHTFKHFDATEMVSNFAPIKKSNCTSCHFQGSADSSCMQCHNYHIGSRVLLSD